MHYQMWEGVVHHVYPDALVSRHLENEPVIVPPVLAKSALVAQPVLRLIWTLAFDALATAERVTFVGYSFPPTDTAARVLFAEALRDLPPPAIEVVGLESTPAAKETLRLRYRRVLGDIPEDRFRFDGALPWVRSLAAFSG